MNFEHNLTAINTKNSCLFISFEGIEGSGKSTQINFTKNYFEQRSYRVICLREPGGTLYGEKLRDAILGSDTPIAPLAEAHLFASSRAQLMEQKIIPFLEQEKSVVIVDRYIDSSFAYQGEARALGFKTIADLHSHAPLNYVPHKTFYLKIDLETSMHRQNLRGNEKDYFEKESQNFYQSLINGYDKCATSFNNRIKTIDATKTIEEVTLQIEEQLALLCK